MHHNRLRDSQNVVRFKETKAVHRIIMELFIILSIINRLSLRIG